MTSHFACNLHGLVTPTLKKHIVKLTKTQLLHFSREVYQLLPPGASGVPWVPLVPPSSEMRLG